MFLQCEVEHQEEEIGSYRCYWGEWRQNHDFHPIHRVFLLPQHLQHFCSLLAIRFSTMEDSDMDKKPAAKIDAEKANLLDSSEKEVGAEEKGNGRKRKNRRIGKSSDSSSASTYMSQE